MNRTQNASPRRTWGALAAAASVAVLAMVFAVAQTPKDAGGMNQAEPPATDSMKGQDKEMAADKNTPKIQKTTEEWKQILTPAQYCIAFDKGTEPAFSNPLHNNHEPGVYSCVACGTPLFGSGEKFDSGTGWPSYFQPLNDDAVTTETDTAYGLLRTEVLCAKCHAHLGHVFDDGPRPTGLRYCINGTSLKFDAAADPKLKAASMINAQKAADSKAAEEADTETNVKAKNQ